MPSNSATYRLTILGRFRLNGPKGPIDLGNKKLRGLLAVLACAGEPLEREKLASLLWGSHQEEQARQNLRQALARLRRILGAEVFTTSGDTIAIAPGQIDCDAAEFKKLRAEGSEDSLEKAVDLYRDRLLLNVSIPEEDWTEWLRIQRQHWESAAIGTLIELATACIARANHDRALLFANRAVAIDNLREDAHRLVIRALAAVGRKAEAIRQYEHLTKILKDELEVDPDPATRALVTEIRKGAANLPVARPAEFQAPLAPGSWANVGGDMPTVLVAAESPPNGAGRSVSNLVIENILRPVARRLGGMPIERPDGRFAFQFPSPQGAIETSFEGQTALANAGHGHAGKSPVRFGAHVAHSLEQRTERPNDIAAILASRAGAGEMWASSEVCDHMNPVFDADVEDLGIVESARALRAFRVTRKDEAHAAASMTGSPMQPLIAVIPFTAYSDTDDRIIGDILADEIISAISCTAELGVISRLSTNALRFANVGLDRIRALLNAHYIVTGRYHVSGDQVNLMVELVNAKSGQVIWSRTLKARQADVAVSFAETVAEIVAAIGASILNHELRCVESQPLHTLENYSLLMGAIGQLHKLSPASFNQVPAMLDEVISRAPRHPIPHAWMAQWHVMRLNQGWFQDFHIEAQNALACTNRALDADSNCSLALATDGFVHTHFLKRFDLASDRFDHAIDINPNDPVVWLHKGTMHAFKGEGKIALEGTEHAASLSPLDPRRWYYDSMAATAALSAHSYDQAIEFAKRSLRGNRAHSSTFRALAISQYLSGKRMEAHDTVTALMRLQPKLTASEYLSRHPASAFETGKLWAKTLQEAGVPA